MLLLFRLAIHNSPFITAVDCAVKFFRFFWCVKNYLIGIVLIAITNSSSSLCCAVCMSSLSSALRVAERIVVII